MKILSSALLSSALLSKKEQCEIVDKIVANAVLAQEAIIKADLPVSQFTHYIDKLISNTTDIVFAINGKEGIEKLKTLTK